MKPVTGADLQPWRDPDELLDALHKLGEQTTGLAVAVDVSSAVAALLQHEDEDLRQEALRLILVQWRDHRLRSEALGVLRLDPSEAVRATAAFGIAAVSRLDTRREDVSAFLEVLLDESQPKHLRGAAYEALLIIHRKTDFPPLTREIKLMVDIDWDWIRKLQAEVSAADA